MEQRALELIGRFSPQGIDTLTDAYTSKRTTELFSGPYGGKALTTLTTNPLRFKPSVEVRNSVRGQLPDILLRVKTRLETAHVLNQMLHALFLGADILGVWQKGILAADALSKTSIPDKLLLELQCRCNDSEDQERACHACALCFRVRRCTDMTLTPDDRLVCSNHDMEKYNQNEPTRSRRGPRIDSVYEGPRTEPLRDLQARSDDVFFLRPNTAIIKSIYSATTREGSFGGGIVSQDALLVKARSFVVDATNGIWKDAYDGNRNAIQDYANRLDTAGSLRWVPLPTAPSLDAIKPFMFLDGDTFLHHENNVVLTAFAFNLLKSYWPASILPILKKAAQQTEKENKGEPRDEAFWQWFNNAMDHVNHIIHCYDKNKDARFQRELTEDMMQALETAWRSGIWTPDLPNLRPPASRLFTSYGDYVSEAMTKGLTKRGPSMRYNLMAPERRPKDKEFRRPSPMWSEAYQRTLAKLVNDMERNPEINIHRLKIPRSSNGAPWPFRPDHMFVNDDNLFLWWHHQALRSFWTMDDECDLEHETDESPATVMLDFVAIWFEKGGVDDFIRCEMTIWLGDPQRASVGRAAGVLPGRSMSHLYFFIH